ncbi:UNVERIFIED_CONTAM: hypothetical protein FKN15_065151 [Acipenser sinensis]
MEMSAVMTGTTTATPAAMTLELGTGTVTRAAISCSQEVFCHGGRHGGQDEELAKVQWRPGWGAEEEGRKEKGVDGSRSVRKGAELWHPSSVTQTNTKHDPELQPQASKNPDFTTHLFHYRNCLCLHH